MVVALFVVFALFVLVVVERVVIIMVCRGQNPQSSTLDRDQYGLVHFFLLDGRSMNLWARTWCPWLAGRVGAILRHRVP